MMHIRPNRSRLCPRIRDSVSMGQSGRRRCDGGMKINFYKQFRSISTSLWLIPVLCVLLGIVVSLSTIAVDRATDYALLPEDMVGGPEAALEILTTVATSMVNLAVLVLTIVLVVVQLAMGQFSPRIVQRLLRDRQSQFAIGLFVATFVHTLLTIREVAIGGPGEPGQVPGVAIVTTFVLSLASIAVLVIYIHHIGQALRVSALVEIAGDNTRKLINKVYPDAEPAADVADLSLVTAEESGVLTWIAHEKLVGLARTADCTLELIPALGEFVPAGGRLFRIDGDPDRVDHEQVHSCVILRLERTLEEDVAYGMRLLVDMAIRALADAPWQDPTTAVQSIDRLHDCLRELVRRQFPDGRHYDEDGELRLTEEVMCWDDYVRLAFTEIRLAGAGSPQVARRILSALEDLLTVAPEDRRPVLELHRDLVLATVARRYEDDRDIELASGRDASGIGVSAREQAEDVIGQEHSSRPPHRDVPSARQSTGSNSFSRRLGSKSS
ncbi:DUF2254 domain-containing protein [Agromyces badenianii]|uniref:DUF2254 domain-containing protein n=1 Tax=Agromyces badenianii TaxID=2080742 RepID=UPI000D5A1758|nr:DUF2254 domain-containing protein [Agromyces badenianii]PWC04292.1 DUF2254 domain-containing protein [Agromyces badenianii]